MSRIFAAVALSTILLAGAGAIGIAEQESGSESETLDGITQLFASGLDAAVVIPIALLAGLVLATLGVFARL